MCPDGFKSEDGGCDESERLVQQAFKPLRTRWHTLSAGLSDMFLPKVRLAAAVLTMMGPPLCSPTGALFMFVAAELRHTRAN